MEKETRKTIKDLSLDFSVKLVMYELSISSKKSGISTNQLIRSGTAIGAMVHEAQGAESRKDFIHKMKIAYKESEETAYWLALMGVSHPENDVEELSDLLTQIKRMLSKIISTSIAKTHLPKEEG